MEGCEGVGILKYGCPYRKPHWHDGGDIYLCQCQGKNMDCVESYERYYNPSNCKYKNPTAQGDQMDIEIKQLIETLRSYQRELEDEILSLHELWQKTDNSLTDLEQMLDADSTESS